MNYTLPEGAQELKTGNDVVVHFGGRIVHPPVVAYCFNEGQITARKIITDSGSFLAMRSELSTYTFVRFFVESDAV